MSNIENKEELMKTRNRLTRLIATAIVVSMLAAIWTAWGPSRVEAVIAIIRQTGVYSVAQGQATSAHVVNTWTGDERGIIVQFEVFDSQGNTLAHSERQTVEIGQASSFDFIPNDGDFEEGRRMAIRVELRVEGTSRNKPGFIATQEVYNVGDGKTTVFLPYIE
jgi:hypothetical protein